MWYSLLLLGYKPVQHVTVLNTVGNCNTMVSIIILYYNINILWDRHRVCGPSLTETSFCGAYLYLNVISWPRPCHRTRWRMVWLTQSHHIRQIVSYSWHRTDLFIWIICPSSTARSRMDWMASLVQTLSASTFSSNILLQLSTGPPEIRDNKQIHVKRLYTYFIITWLESLWLPTHQTVLASHTSVVDQYIHTT